MALSDKQWAVERELLAGKARRIVVSGMARSGKTRACVLAIGSLALTRPGEYLVCAPTVAQIRGVILAEFSRLWGKSFTVNAGKKQAYLGNSILHLFSGKTEAAESTIRGLTVRGVYIDEAVAVPDSFLQQASLRASQEPRSILLSTNPDSPFHPIKTGWIDRADADDTMSAFAFTFADNPSLPEGYAEDQARTLSGAMLRRMVYGEWSLATGSIYGNIAAYAAPPDVDAPVLERWIGVDYGHTNPTHAVLLVAREVDGERVLYAEREWRHAGKDDVRGPLSHDEKAAAILAALGRAGGVFVDPAEPALTAAFLRQGARAMPAVNKVDVGIQQVQTAIERGRLFVDMVNCPHLAREMAGYAWDDKALLRGEHRPKKVDDHGPDALRYAVESTAKRGPRALGIRDNRRVSGPEDV